MVIKRLSRDRTPPVDRSGVTGITPFWRGRIAVPAPELLQSPIFSLSAPVGQMGHAGQVEQAESPPPGGPVNNDVWCDFAKALDRYPLPTPLFPETAPAVV